MMGEPLVWSRNPPGDIGFYWYRVPTAEPTIVKVDRRFGILVASFDACDARVPVVSLSDAHWAGPIAEPIEAH